VTAEEAPQLCAALERSKYEGMTDPHARSQQHPDIQSLLQDYRSAAGEYARDQVMSMCSEGGFEMDWLADPKDVILRSLEMPRSDAD